MQRERDRREVIKGKDREGNRGKDLLCISWRLSGRIDGERQVRKKSRETDDKVINREMQRG